MTLELRVEPFQEEHIESYVRLSRAEYGEHAAVSQPDHLRWKFIENPQGPAVGVHLYRDGTLIGRMVALPRQFFSQGRRYTAAHIVDFLIDSRERGMKPLLQLVLGLRQLSVFDFLLIMAPNPAGASVWEKFVKMPGLFDLDVAVIPLRPAALLQSSGKFCTGTLSAALDLPWTLFAGGLAGIGGWASSTRVEIEWPPDEELDQLWSERPQDQILGLRSADYLRWRYKASPIFRYNVFFLRQGRRLVGYFATRRTIYSDMECLFVVDAFGEPSLPASAWRAASLPETSRAALAGVELVMLMGNCSCGSLSRAAGLPFLRVPPRVLPRKTTVYAQWVSSPAIEIRRDNFCCTLGDSDVI